MRIAFFVDVFPRLSNTFINNQLTGLLDRGHEVDIFARSLGDFAAAQPEMDRYRLTDRLAHIEIPHHPAARLWTALRLVARRGSLHPVVLDALDFRRYGRGAWSLAQLYTSLSFLERSRYDIVHCQFGKLAPLLLRLRDRNVLRAGLVTSFRGADLTRHLPQRPGLFRELFDKGDLFLPVSGAFRARLLDAGCDPEKIVVHHSGIICDRFEFRERTLDRGETAKLLFVGRLTEKKGVGYALEAVAGALKAGHDVEIDIVGDGEERARLEGQIEELGLAARVRLLGPREHSAVIGLLHQSHLLLAPSVTASDGDQEGIPNVLKEAMATGAPVLSTRHSGIPELVDDGVSGYLVEERDEAGLTRALIRLLDEPESWPAMGRAGRAKVEAQFDSARLNDELVELYRRVVGKAGTAGSPESSADGVPVSAARRTGTLGGEAR